MICFNFRHASMALLAAALLAAPAWAQRWEFGAGGGASIYNSQSISGGTSVDAKFNPGGGLSAYLGQIGDRLGGEIRYTMFWNQMKLSASSGSFTMNGRSQALGYNLLIYMNKKHNKARGYFLVGGGVKQYTGTGSEVAMQPLGQFAVLTKTSQWKPMVTAGFGVRVNLTPHADVRAELLAHGTQAPTDVITPLTGSLNGWYFALMPVFSLSYVW